MAADRGREGRAPTPLGASRAEAATVAEAEWGALAGVYTPDDGGSESIEILVRENALTLRSDGRKIALRELEDDLLLAPDAAFDRFPFHVERPPNGLPELWHGGRRYVRAGSDPSPLAEPSADLRSIAGHYRSHNPWTTNFRVVLRGDQPWLIFAAPPDGFDAEQPLVPLPDGSFRIGQDPKNPESLRFDTVLDGRALRGWLSGWPYYRVD